MPPFSLPMHILVVEHKRVIASQVTKLLVAWGHEITYCGHDGHQVLDLVERRPPDLLLTGLYLKGSMPGLELIDRLWARWDIPVVVLSGTDPGDLPAAWRDRPGLFFLAKPFLPSQLYGIIEEVWGDSDVDP